MAGEGPARPEPGWVSHAIWWQVYPLGFTAADPTGSDRTPAHRLLKLVDWLDYIVELGASGLMLGPVFESSTHGYDTIDYLRIDPRLGDADDFARLVDQAHQRGLRVLLDGVFNHVGREFPAFQQVLAAGPHAAGSAAGWFRLRWTDTGAPEYDAFEGHSGLVELDHRQPEVADFVVQVMTHWLEAGADGWRLDAAYAVPAEFWAQVLPRVRQRFADAYFVGEVIHGDYPAIVAGSGMDSVTQYELWKAVWSSLNDVNLFELAHALHRHDGYLDSFVPQTFLGNHDVTRLASRLTDARLLPLALAVLFTVAGTPSIYYGDEQAFRGVKHERVGGDDEVRPPMPAGGPHALSELGGPTLSAHQELIGLRRRHPWLHRARLRQLHLTNTVLVYECRGETDRLVVALNAGADPVSQPVPGVREVRAGSAELAEPGTDRCQVTVAGRGWVVLA